MLETRRVLSRIQDRDGHGLWNEQGEIRPEIMRWNHEEALVVRINELESMRLCDNVGVLLLVNAKQAHSNEAVRTRDKNEAKRMRRNEAKRLNGMK